MHVYNSEYVHESPRLPNDMTSESDKSRMKIGANTNILSLTAIGTTKTCCSCIELTTNTSAKSAPESGGVDSSRRPAECESRRLVILLPSSRGAPPSIECSGYEKQAYLFFSRSGMQLFRGNQTYVS